MKILKYIAAIGIGLFCIFLGYSCFTFDHTTKKHKQRIKDAEALMTSYTQADWRDLYNECLPLIGKPKSEAIDPDLWPARVKQLNPINVFIPEDGLFMHWTGGFDDETLYLYVLGPVPKSSKDSPPELPGIQVFGLDSIPERPYIAK